jgi:hypothetical protein
VRLGPFYATAWRNRQHAATGFFFRLFGYGLHVSTRKPEAALFSERYGYRKALYLFGLRFEVLKP